MTQPEAKPPPRTGILGGTFDPIHLGHLRAAEEMRDRLGLDRVILVPSATPPHKVGTEGAPLASAELRLEWTQAAVAGRPGLTVDALELRRNGPSYTIDTVREIGDRVAPERPVFLIGDDAFALFATWRAPDELVRLAHFAVMTRSLEARGTLRDWLPESIQRELEISPDGTEGRHPQAGTWIRIVPIDALPISSSEVRRRLRQGRSVRYLIPEKVRAAIESSGVYGAPLEAEPSSEAGAHP